MKDFLTQRRKGAKTQRNQRSILRSVCLVLNFASLRLCVFALIFFIPVAAQRVAILAPDASDGSREFAEKIEAKLDGKLAVVDDSISEVAFLAAKAETPFNMTAAAAKAIGTAIGCDFFVLVGSETLRRSSSKKSEYYESYAAVYAVSSRTGRLVFWKLSSFEAPNAQDSKKQLNAAAHPLASDIVDKLNVTIKSELAEMPAPAMEEPPEEGSPAAKNFRAPIPYRRIKPEYTAQAFLYGVEATVDMLVDLDARGAILSTEIVRWAGFGLDESVEKTVHAMSWRPAERSGKALPMRFLLRYNFRKTL
jgi:hypothetical protein